MDQVSSVHHSDYISQASHISNFTLLVSIYATTKQTDKKANKERKKETNKQGGASDMDEGGAELRWSSFGGCRPP